MKALAMAVILFCAGCEADKIRACGYACKEANSKMVKCSETDGCVCSTPAGAETAK